MAVRLWRSLVEPHRGIKGDEDRQGARLFANLMLINIILVVVLLVVVNYFTTRYFGRGVWQDEDTWVVVAGWFVVASSFVILRLGKYRPAIALYIISTAAVPLTSPFMDDPHVEIGLLTLIFIPILLSAFVFRVRWVTAILLGLPAIAGWRIANSSLPLKSKGTAFNIIVCVLIAGALTIAFRLRFRSLEKARLDRIREGDAALQRTTERLRVLLSNSMDILMGIDRDAIVSFIGGALESTTGYKVEDRLGHPIYDLIHREDLERVRAEISAVKQVPGKSVRMEWRQMHRDGHVQWYEALATNRLGHPGLDNIIINLREVTDRRNAEEFMRLSEAKYRNLFETVLDGIFISDDTGRILEVNNGACRMLGYTREELTVRNLSDITPKPETLDFLRKELMAGRMGPHEVDNVRKDGAVIPVDLMVSAIIYEGRYAFLGLAHDITERKKVQAEKRRLESQVEQATRMETVGRLAGGIAHDFNNLLTIILGHAELLESELEKGHPGVSRVNVIRGAGKNASLLVQHLLAFSRKEILAPRVLNLNEQITSVLRMSSGLVTETIKVEFIPDPGLASVRMDPGVIERTIINLALNARDAMPNGGKLTIRTANATVGLQNPPGTPDLSPGRYAVITVSDTGTGMPESVKAHIFEPFFSTKPRSNNTGLGLATVYGAIAQAEGHIQVESEVGRGTVFTIYIPSVQDPADEHRKPAQAPALPRGTETILYAEDEDGVREFTSHMIEGFGYRVLSAPTGNIALEMAERHSGPIHLYFTDTIMPGLNGRQTADRLSAIHPETRVLFTSGYSADILSMSGVVDDGIDFIPKPYSRIDLAKRIRAILDARPG